MIAAAEELWNKVCTGSPASLAPFVEQSRQCADLTASIGHTDLKRLGQGLGAIANWLAEDAARYNATVAMEVVSWAGRNSSKVYLTTLLHMMLTIHIARGARPQLGVFNVDYTIAISPHRDGFTTFAMFAEGVQNARCVTPPRPWYSG